MRKQELVQLHALCVVVHDHLDDRHECAARPFDRYREYGVSPTSIHRRKGRHKEALFRLLDGLVDTVDELPGEQQATPPSSK